MHKNADVRCSVRRISIVGYLTRPSALRLLNAGALGCKKRSAAGNIRGQPHLRIPRDDLACGVHCATKFERLRRTFGIPGELVFTHPLNTYGLPERFRQQECVGCRIVTAIGSIRTGTIEVNYTQLALGYAEE